MRVDSASPILGPTGAFSARAAPLLMVAQLVSMPTASTAAAAIVLKFFSYLQILLYIFNGNSTLTPSLSEVNELKLSRCDLPLVSM